MWVERVHFLVLTFLICFAGSADAQSASAQNQAQAPTQPQSQPPAQAQVLAQSQGTLKISLDDAIQMALEHNHTLLATRTMIQQNEAQETTANLRPNPVFLVDEQYMPFFSPDAFTTDYINQSAVYDMCFSYLIERGKKRQHRLQAAKDQTSVTRSQVADNERTLSFNVAQLF